MKTLEKERNRRYDTVSALALDIKRHMDTEPILARPPQAVYRLQKFLRRHRTQVTVAMMAAGLVVVLIAFLSIWSHSQKQRIKEESEKHRRALADAEHSFVMGQPAQALVQARSLLDSGHVKREASLLVDQILTQAQEKVSDFTVKIVSTPEDPNHYLRLDGAQ